MNCFIINPIIIRKTKGLLKTTKIQNKIGFRMLFGTRITTSIMTAKTKLNKLWIQ